MRKQKILIVEDDKNISRLLKYNLEKAGYQCIVCVTVESALEVLDSQPLNLVILDLMLPDGDGLEVCKQIKQDIELTPLPVIILTAKGEEVDRVVGFELGADDYVVKPFSPRELVLRVKAILKRSKSKSPAFSILTAGALSLDVSRHRVTVGNKQISLTPMEFKLLKILLSRKGRVQSREQLLEEVWDIASDVTTRTVDTHIKRLREKLGKMGKLIETVRGAGYRLEEKE